MKPSFVGAPAIKTCLSCGNPLKTDEINLKEEKAGQIFIMEKVPAYICDNCHEIWILDLILKEFKSYIKLRSVKYGGSRKR
jgi:YgiT-type zinc finger domain-containing protein